MVRLRLGFDLQLGLGLGLWLSFTLRFNCRVAALWSTLSLPSGICLVLHGFD